MAIPKIEERTFYEPLIRFLREIGFKAIGETTIGDQKQPDVLFQIEDLKFVVEVKLGTKVGLKAVAQASDYAKRLKTENVIILFYPEKYKNQKLLDFDYIKRIALDEEIEALILTEYWTENLNIKPSELFKNLLNLIETRQYIEKRKVDPRTVIKLIEDYVIELNAITYQIKTEELVGEVVNKLELFSALGEGKIKDPETANRQVIYLASYLLFNQLLFYHIYRKKTKNDLSEIREIECAEDLQKYFDEITRIDYQSIYKVNILGHIPNKKEVIQTLNEVIKAIKLLRAEYVTQDLAGRFFHDLIPHEVRKVLAAFYTHPIAAEILSSLAINSWDETVTDPACGSGTLLVAAYIRKKQLYEELYGYNDLKGMHKKFIEEDITGIDIMPFAAHITTINLATQNLEQETNIVRIAAGDSLEYSLHLRDVDKEQRLLFETVGIPIETYTEKIQQTMIGASRQKGASGAISPSGKGYKFFIKPSDTIIMNPPFTDRHKMESVYRGRLSVFKDLETICGSSVDFWGYFVALAHLLIKKGGVIGAVIPLSIARGKTSKTLRYFLINNYHIKYIIKPYDLAWSEGAAFGDIILIAEKKIPEDDDLTSIIFFKKSHREMSSEEALEIVDKIRKSKPIVGEIIHSEAFDILPVDKKTLEKNKDSLMYLLGGRDFENREILKSFNNTVYKKADQKLLYTNPKEIQVGFGVDKEGIADLIFITRPITDKSRASRAMLILEDERKDEVVAKVKDTDIRITISREKILPALRTITSINKLGLNGSHDYFIKDNYEGFKTVYNLSNWNKKRKFDWEHDVKSKLPELSHVVLVEKANPFSPNTSFLSIYSDKGIITPHVFWIFKNLNKEDSKIMSLFLNSIVFLVQYFLLKSETTGQTSHILKEDLILTKVINVKEITENIKEEIIKIFTEIKDIEFPSILEQIENKFEYRIKLDTTILQALGFSKSEINDLLPKVYDALLKEIKAGRRVA